MYELNIVGGKLRVLMGHTASGDRVVLVVPASRVYVAASRLVGKQEVELNVRCPKGSMNYEVEPKASEANQVADAGGNHDDDSTNQELSVV